ncbi:MAG: DUF2493 domain-containing protein [Candidatus Saccharibacteria bacterium]
MTIHLAIVGSRNFTDYTKFVQYLDEWIFNHGKPVEIISGGCIGADSLAAQYAKENNIPLTIFPADWLKYGKAAGPIRNEKIVNSCTNMLAFPANDSKGTTNAISRAQKKNIPVTIVPLY